MQFLVRRLAFAAVLVIVVSSAALVFARLAPGDITSDLYGSGAGAAEIARERARLGLDQPVFAQYRAWFGSALRLDLGTSLLYRRPVGELVRERAANTAMLAVAALLLATAIGVPLGVIAGSRQSGPLRIVIRAGSLLVLSVPPLVTSLLLVMIAARTGVLPIGGMTSTPIATGAAWWIDVAWHLALPACALALPLAAHLERTQAQAMEETLRQTFVTAAIARGVTRRTLLARDALRVAVKPVAAIFGLVLGTLLSGSFIVEVITAWPGLGRLMYDALRARDVYLVAGGAAAGSIFIAAGTLLSDVMLALLDPRERAT